MKRHDASDFLEGKAEVVLPADSRAPGRARALLAGFLNEKAIAGSARDLALLVVSELVTNAVTHGSGEGDEVGVDYALRSGWLRICVTDAARGSAVPVALSPDTQRPAGRGLQIIDRYAVWSERIVGGRRQVRAELAV